MNSTVMEHLLCAGCREVRYSGCPRVVGGQTTEQARTVRVSECGSLIPSSPQVGRG